MAYINKNFKQIIHQDLVVKKQMPLVSYLFVLNLGQQQKDDKDIYKV
jgi:hypothetical protein